MRLLRLPMLAAVLFAVWMLVPAAGQAAGTELYTVRPGDTLWKIAVRYQVGLSELIRANPWLKNPSLIYPGYRIVVPLYAAEKQVEAQVVQLVNRERAARGLPPLRSNWELARVARFKSQDMRDRRYFSHISPTYGSPFDMMRAFRIPFRTAGENIAAGQPTARQVVQSWMNSPGHRQNILNPQFTQIGVGYAQGGSYGFYWTQMFIRP